MKWRCAPDLMDAKQIKLDFINCIIADVIEMSYDSKAANEFDFNELLNFLAVNNRDDEIILDVLKEVYNRYHASKVFTIQGAKRALKVIRFDITLAKPNNKIMENW